jgi:hypothetical protein
LEGAVADASAAPGGRQVAGTWVDRKGAAEKLVPTVTGGEVGGTVGSFTARRVAGRSSAVVETPDFGRDGYLAVGENDVELVRAKQGLMKLNVTDAVVARATRGEVTRVELGSGTLACPLTIPFSDEARWEFDVPRSGRSAARRVVTSLGG